MNRDALEAELSTLKSILDDKRKDWERAAIIYERRRTLIYGEHSVAAKALNEAKTALLEYVTDTEISVSARLEGQKDLTLCRAVYQCQTIVDTIVRRLADMLIEAEALSKPFDDARHRISDIEMALRRDDR